MRPELKEIEYLFPSPLRLGAVAKPLLELTEEGLGLLCRLHESSKSDPTQRLRTHLAAVFGPLWGALGRLWDPLGSFWGTVGLTLVLSLALFGKPWDALGVSLAPFGPPWGPPWLLFEKLENWTSLSEQMWLKYRACA